MILADSWKKFQNAASLAFASKYGRHTIILDFMGPKPGRSAQSIVRTDRSISVSAKEIILYDF